MENIKKRMTIQDVEFYKDIFAPREVAVPLSNAWSHMSVLKDGRIREYGAYPRTAAKNHRRAYIESCDGGLSWKEHIFSNQGGLDNNPVSDYVGNAVYNKDIGKYISVILNSGEMFYTESDSQDEKPTKVVKIDLGEFKFGHGFRSIIELDKKDRLCFMVYVATDEKYHCYQSLFVYSDDKGNSWKYSKLKALGRVEKGPRDKGERWQNFSCEPAFVELSDGTLMALVRTSHYVFYQYYSYDSGETWTDPEPSIFHAFVTQPVLHKLSDGRILMLWSNSMPLAETDHNEESIKDDSEAVEGIWEDVFTNRDMLNIAISEDDGKTWKGYREIALNSIRNSNYFRSQGGIVIGHDDKSLHQSQVLEMPYNKLLVCVGQHDVLRRIYLLDIDWIYEENREDDLRNGLENFSTQLYVKSVLGSFKGFSGHASYNRTHGAMLVPDNIHEEAMLIRRIPDELLVSDLQGAVWNYPLLREGKVTVKYKVKGDGLRLGLADFWINPSDPYAFERNIVSFGVSNKTDDWSLAEIKFNHECEVAELYINGELSETKTFDKNTCHGFCYLHIQTLAEREDREGTLIKFVKSEKI